MSDAAVTGPAAGTPEGNGAAQAAPAAAGIQGQQPAAAAAGAGEQQAKPGIDVSGAPDPAAAPAAGEQPSPLTGTFAGLADPDNQALVRAKGWDNKTLDEVLKSHRELESKIGTSVTVPKADATAEEWSAFYAKVGRPDDAGKYEFQVPEGATHYNQDTTDKFRVWAHKAGLTPAQAKIIHDEFVAESGQVYGKAIQTVQQRADAAEKALVETWGDVHGPEYSRNMQYANLVIKNNGGQDLVKEMQSFGIISEKGEVQAPLLTKLFANLGKANYSEGRALTGDPGVTVNPWADGTLNVAEQDRLFAEAEKNPAKRPLVKNMINASKRAPFYAEMIKGW